MDALMDSLNDSIPMPFGVRRLHTPNGKTPIRSLDELQPHGRCLFSRECFYLFKHCFPDTILKHRFPE
uniref:Doublecortin domain-containing protein n=1 Tax=Meloidogyne incognita TaxID=6306 RepID=A0A914MH28_MELIC